MSRGLRIAPNDAKSTGNRFGKGIYFSDSFQFSHNYSCGRSLNPFKQKKSIPANQETRNYMLLCEVALGKQKELRSSSEYCESLPSGFDSVKALGRQEPDPSNNVSLPNGCIIPLGQLVNSQYKPDEYYQVHYRSNENQYVVYNEAQVCIRYILQYHADH
jgi:hypothetical protein